MLDVRAPVQQSGVADLRRTVIGGASANVARQSALNLARFFDDTSPEGVAGLFGTGVKTG